MLKLLILRFWPVLLPVLFYLAWLAFARRKAGKSGEKKPGFFDGPWLWPVVATLLLTMGAFLWLGFSAQEVDGIYVPAQQVDGKIIPGHVIPDPQE